MELTLLRPCVWAFSQPLALYQPLQHTYDEAFLMMNRLGRISGLDALDTHGMYDPENM